jgi:hypothetical protein
LFTVTEAGESETTHDRPRTGGQDDDKKQAHTREWLETHQIRLLAEDDRERLVWVQAIASAQVSNSFCLFFDKVSLRVHFHRQHIVSAVRNFKTD